MIRTSEREMGALIRIMAKHVARRFGTTLGECFRCVAGDERETEIIAFSHNLRAHALGVLWRDLSRWTLFLRCSSVCSFPIFIVA